MPNKKPQWLQTLLDQPGAKATGKKIPEPSKYASEVYRPRKSASLGMSEVELEEDEWTFAEEAWGEQRIGVHTLEVLHRPGIQQAIDHNVDLEKCYASRIAIRKPHLTKDTAATLVRLLPAEVWDHGRVYWNLGLDHYQYDRDFGTHNITLYMVDRHLDQSVYTGPGATRPQLQLRLHRFPMEVVQTPDWIQHEWTRSAGKSLSEDEDDGRR